MARWFQQSIGTLTEYFVLENVKYVWRHLWRMKPKELNTYRLHDPRGRNVVNIAMANVQQYYRPRILSIRKFFKIANQISQGVLLVTGLISCRPSYCTIARIKLNFQNKKLNFQSGTFMNGSNYEFPAVRGIQAGREYYVVMCPLKLVPRLFVFNDYDVPAHMRAQRVLNKARIPDIVRYLTTNTEDYVLSSITACIDGGIHFAPLATSGLERNIGTLKIDMRSRILVNDGQHRRAAIAQALKECPRLGDETISVVFYVDAGLQRSQQWFTDLNKHAIRPTKSITILYDGRDPMSKLARDLVRTVPIFSDGLTELEKTTISNRSKALFTLSAVHQATRALLGKAKQDVIKASEAKLAEDFWIYLGEIVPDWQAIIRQETSPYDLRTLCINAYGVTLHALGMVGRAVTQLDLDWRQKLKGLADIDWARENKVWQERTIIQGKISKSHESVMLTTSAIKNSLGITLDREEIDLEARLLSRSKG